MEFKQLKLEHIDIIRSYFVKCDSRLCDRTIGGTMMWRDYYHTEFAEQGGALFLKAVMPDGRTAFTAPFAEDEDRAYDALMDHCRNAGILPDFCMLPADRLRKVIMLVPAAKIYTSPDWYDYLYDANDMREMAGRRFSGQRNHINKFMKLYPDWSFERIDRSNIAQAREFFTDFIDRQERQKESATLTEGDRKTVEILDNYELFGFCGGILRAGSDIVGFALGEVLGDVLFIHTEKADREYPGAYQMLVREFARAYATEDIRYINREEDDGDEGLRTSKQSYHPVRLLEKYNIRVEE